MNKWSIGPLKVVGEEEEYIDHYIVIENKTITDICPSNKIQIDETCIQLDQQFVAMPGMIDQHIHGTHGADVMDATSDSLQVISNTLVRYGVTSFLATTLTASADEIERSLQCVAQTKKELTGAKLLGVHLEGPFIHAAQKGAQSASLIQSPSINMFQQFESAANHEIKLITMASELDEGQQLSRYLKDQRIPISIGHSDATYEQIMPLLNEGLIDCATHFSNGMRKIHHREPGLQVALLQSDCYLEIIADGHHLHPHYIKWIINQVGIDRIILISDSMRAAGQPDGMYHLGDQKVILTEGICKLVNGDSLAGSVLNLHVARNNMKMLFGLTDLQLAKITSTNSAKLLNIYEYKGSLKAGKDADFYILDNNDNVVMTVIEGLIMKL